MNRHISNTSNRLADLAGLSERTERTEQRILEQATKRLDAVQSAIDRARPGVEAAPDSAQERYLDLVAERGRLGIVIAKAKKVLA